MLQFVTELYHELIYKHKLKKLPVVFPLLLYNGDRKWTASVSLEGLIDIPEKLQQLKCYIPYFRYYPVIVNELSLEELESISAFILKGQYLKKSINVTLENS